MAKKKDKKQQSFKKAVQKAGNNLSQSEAKEIAKKTGKSVAQVASKATQMQIGVGAKLSNQISSALATPGSSQAQNLGITRASTDTREALAGLSGVNLNKGQVYQGAYTTSTPATSQNLGSGYGVRTTTSSSQVNPVIGTRLPKTKKTGQKAGPYDGAMDGPTEGPASDGGSFDFQSMLDAMTAAQQPQFDMGALTDMFNTQFEQLSSQFDMMDPLQLAQLGQAYGGDAIRARQRARRTRGDYRRGLPNMLGSVAPTLASMGIGGGLTL